MKTPKQEKQLVISINFGEGYDEAREQIPWFYRVVHAVMAKWGKDLPRLTLREGGSKVNFCGTLCDAASAKFHYESKPLLQILYTAVPIQYGSSLFLYNVDYFGHSYSGAGTFSYDREAFPGEKLEELFDFHLRLSFEKYSAQLERERHEKLGVAITDDEAKKFGIAI